MKVGDIFRGKTTWRRVTEVFPVCSGETGALLCHGIGSEAIPSDQVPASVLEAYEAGKELTERLRRSGGHSRG